MSKDTKTRLMDATEVLVAQHGITGTSVRDIAQAASANIAMVKYHFGSKEKLIEATLTRQLEPLNAQRLALLTALELQHPRGILPLEGVLEALIRPVVELGLANSTKKEGQVFLRLVGRLFSEPASAIHIILRQMREVITRFDKAFARALPEMNEADLSWRKMASFGVVQHTILMVSLIDQLPIHLRIPAKVIKGTPKPELVLKQLVTFCAAGMRTAT
jgi:AcrR family transcriptional regulator